MSEVTSRSLAQRFLRGNKSLQAWFPHLYRGWHLHTSCLVKRWRVKWVLQPFLYHYINNLESRRWFQRRQEQQSFCIFLCKQVNPAQLLTLLRIGLFQTTHPSSSSGPTSCLSWSSWVYFQNGDWDECVHPREKNIFQLMPVSPLTGHAN